MLFFAAIGGLCRGMYNAIRRGEGVRRKSDGQIMSAGSWLLAALGAGVLVLSLLQLMK